jgi:hypothetical protein
MTLFGAFMNQMYLKTLVFKFLVLISLLITLTSCGSSELSIAKLETPLAQNPYLVGTDGALIPIESDNVSAAGYNEDSLVMTVQFDNGAIYEYYGVPTDLWISFIEAQPHPWSAVGYPRLVQGGIPYKRIG